MCVINIVHAITNTMYTCLEREVGGKEGRLILCLVMKR